MEDDTYVFERRVKRQAEAEEKVDAENYRGPGDAGENEEDDDNIEDVSEWRDERLEVVWEESAEDEAEEGLKSHVDDGILLKIGVAVVVCLHVVMNVYCDGSCEGGVESVIVVWVGWAELRDFEGRGWHLSGVSARPCGGRCKVRADQTGARKDGE